MADGTQEVGPDLAVTHEAVEGSSTVSRSFGNALAMERIDWKSCYGLLLAVLSSDPSSARQLAAMVRTYDHGTSGTEIFSQLDEVAKSRERAKSRELAPLRRDPTGDRLHYPMGRLLRAAADGILNKIQKLATPVLRMRAIHNLKKMESKGSAVLDIIRHSFSGVTFEGLDFKTEARWGDDPNTITLSVSELQLKARIRNFKGAVAMRTAGRTLHARPHAEAIVLVRCGSKCDGGDM